MIFDQYFYHPDLTQNVVTLSREESEHCVRALRHRAGDQVLLTDGKGHEATAVIMAENPKACMVELVEVREANDKPFYRLHLAVAPTKNIDRIEWLVEKCVEIGIESIHFIICDHSERTFLKTERLEKLAVSAMKQSLHTLLPAIHPAVRLSDWISTFNFQPTTQKLIAHCEADQPRTPLAAALQPGCDAVVLIGPEGDFSSDEIALAQEKGFVPVSLGPSRLRTETAAIYAVTAFNLINDRL